MPARSSGLHLLLCWVGLLYLVVHQYQLQHPLAQCWLNNAVHTVEARLKKLPRQ